MIIGGPGDGLSVAGRTLVYFGPMWAAPGQTFTDVDVTARFGAAVAWSWWLRVTRAS